MTVPFGYADGYPRRLFDAGAEVLINGRRYPLAGSRHDGPAARRLSATTRSPLGDDVVLLGRQGDEVITADEWAGGAETITWEILCGIGARVPARSRGLSRGGTSTSCPRCTRCALSATRAARRRRLGA